MEADLGNLFLSNRVKKIFEILFPDQCTYKKTFIYQSQISTKWWLAIPKNIVVNGEVVRKVKRCKACNEPLYAHPGTQFDMWLHEAEAPFDIAKSKNWHSRDENDWRKSWISRDSFLSLRLISLLKKIGAKGIYKSSISEFSKFKQLIKAEKIWVENALDKIGILKDIPNQEISGEDIEKFKFAYSINNSDLEVLRFEKKFKITANEIVRNICNIKSGTEINLGFDAPFVVEEIGNWKMTETKFKLIAFAFDDYGNYLLFSPMDKSCPVYFYDHETMLYDLIQSSIIKLAAI